MNHSR